MEESGIEYKFLIYEINQSNITPKKLKEDFKNLMKLRLFLAIKKSNQKQNYEKYRMKNDTMLYY